MSKVKQWTLIGFIALLSAFSIGSRCDLDLDVDDDDGFRLDFDDDDGFFFDFDD